MRWKTICILLGIFAFGIIIGLAFSAYHFEERINQQEDQLSQMKKATFDIIHSDKDIIALSSMAIYANLKAKNFDTIEDILLDEISDFYIRNQNKSDLTDRQTDLLGRITTAKRLHPKIQAKITQREHEIPDQKTEK